MRFACGDMRDHILSYQNDHRPSYWRRRALRQQERLRIDFREIFRVVRFSTFATISARTGPPAMSAIRSLTGVDRTWRRRRNSVEIDPSRSSASSQFASVTQPRGANPLRLLTTAEALRNPFQAGKLPSTSPGGLTEFSWRRFAHSLCY
jgi:hypothetical protein